MLIFTAISFVIGWLSFIRLSMEDRNSVETIHSGFSAQTCEKNWTDAQTRADDQAVMSTPTRCDRGHLFCEVIPVKKKSIAYIEWKYKNRI